MTDQFAGHEIARHEIAGHKHDGQKSASESSKKYSFDRDNITMKCAIFKTTTL